MANFPDVIETFSHESNADVSGVGGTVIDADDQNAVYDLLAALETWVGPNTDTAASASHEGRLQALEAVSALTNPMTTAGDTLYASDGSGTPARLGIGTTGQVLTVTGGLPAWADAAGGFSDPLTTSGDLLYRNGSNVTDRLGVGSAGQYLGITSGLPAWKTPAYIADPAGAPVGAVLVKNASSAWSYLAPSSTTGDVLTGQGVGAVPIWTAVPAQVPGSDIPAPGGERVGAILQWDGSIYDTLLPGTSGQVLTAHGDNNVSGSLLTWATPSSGLTNPMTTLSDLIIGDTGGAAIRLGIGSSRQVLTVVSGAPAWANLGGDSVDTYLDYTGQSSAPSTPSTHHGRLYVLNADDHLYFKGPDGTAHDLLAASATVIDYATPNWIGGD